MIFTSQQGVVLVSDGGSSLGQHRVDIVDGADLKIEREVRMIC